MNIFKWNIVKNQKLKKERGISFEDIIQKIALNNNVFDIPHPNPLKYPNQNIFIVEIDDYAYLVPYIIDGDICFLKTIIPSRKATKYFLKGEKNGKNKN